MRLLLDTQAFLWFVLNDDQKRALVLELFAQDVQGGLDAAVAEKRQELVQFVESLLDKYRVSFNELQRGRSLTQQSLSQMLERLRYA